MEQKKSDQKISLDTNRLEIFSDAVMAVIITIAVLNFKIPQGKDLAALLPLMPVFLTYLISFQTVATYWNNHHHLLRTSTSLNSSIMWANHSVLFSLSLVPFAAGWLGENLNQKFPTLLYTLVLLLCSISFQFLIYTIRHNERKNSVINKSIGSDVKGKLSVGLYVVSVAVALFVPWISYVCLIIVAITWFLPDQRIEKNKNI